MMRTVMPSVPFFFFSCSLSYHAGDQGRVFLPGRGPLQALHGPRARPGPPGHRRGRHDAAVGAAGARGHGAGGGGRGRPLPLPGAGRSGRRPQGPHLGTAVLEGAAKDSSS